MSSIPNGRNHPNEDDADLVRIARAVSDGGSVDWETELQRRPDLAPLLSKLRALEGLSGAHQEREPAAPVPALDRPTWGPLRLLEPIGGGTFGTVYRALDPRLDREVALKLLLLDPPMSAAEEAQALEEGRALARVRHANVLVVHGADRHDGQLGIWSDLVRGLTLEALLERDGGLGAREAAGIGMDLCRALAAVHALGLVHRDVKTSNVMREDGGRIVLMDFGAAATSGAAAQRQGTPLAMAPEMLRGGPATPAADIYGLGVLLFRLVTGRYPVEADTLEELETRHRRREANLLADLRPELPPAFIHVVERAIDPDPTRRFASVGAMERALASLAATHEQAKPQVWMVAVAVVVLVGGAWLAWQALTPALPLDEARTVAPPGTETRTTGSQNTAPPAVTATLYRDHQGKESALAAGDPVTPGDGLSLELRTIETLHVYVLNQDLAGAVFVLYPSQNFDLGNPLPQGTHRLPGTREGAPVDWEVTSAGGRETVVVVASRSPLRALERDLAGFMRADKERPVDPGSQASGEIGALRGVGSVKPSRPQGGKSPRLDSVLSRLPGENPGETWIWKIDLESRAR